LLLCNQGSSAIGSSSPENGSARQDAASRIGIGYSNAQDIKSLIGPGTLISPNVIAARLRSDLFFRLADEEASDHNLRT
jgi:hypothetical protein